MEAFNIADELKQWAEAKDWVFLLGDQFYANIEATEDYDVSDEQFRQIDAGQPVLWCNLEANETRAIGNRVSAINYTGLLGLGIKKDADYSILEDAKTNANLDETFKQKYDRRLKDLLQLFSNEMKMFACANNLQILDSSYVYDINKFDTNIDFVIGTFDIEQESFTIVPNEVDLTLTAEPGGSIEPYEGVQAQNKYSTVPINAVPDTNYAFKEWIIDGVKVLDKLTSVFMNRAKLAIAYFESLLTIIQNIISTDYKNKGYSYYINDSVENNDIRFRIKNAINLNGTDNSIDTQFFSQSIVDEFAMFIDIQDLIQTSNKYIYDTTKGAKGIGIRVANSSTLAVFGYYTDSSSFNINVPYLGATDKSILIHFSLSQGFVRVYKNLILSGELPVTLAMSWDNTISDLIGDRYDSTAFTSFKVKKLLRSSEVLTESQLLNQFLKEDSSINYDYRFHFQELNSEVVVDAENGNKGFINGTINRIELDRDDTPILYLNGYSLFENDSTNELAYYAYDKAGNPTVTIKAGWTKLEEVAKNKLNDAYKYRYAYDTDLAIIQSLQGANVLSDNLNPTISFNELDSIVNESLIQVVKNANDITSINAFKVEEKKVFIKRTETPIAPINPNVTEQLEIYVQMTDTIFQHFVYVHEVEHSIIYVDYWRLSESHLSDYNGNDFTDRTELLLTEFENEYTTMFAGEGDQTGGVHGKERIDLEAGDSIICKLDGIEYLINEIPTSSFIEGGKFEVIQNSTMYKESDKSILANHIKTTTFWKQGYDCNNILTLAVNYEMFIYSALVAIATDVSKYISDESLSFIPTIQDSQNKLNSSNVANKEGYFYNDDKDLFAYVNSWIDGYTDDYKTEFYITDRTNDAKYYRNSTNQQQEVGKVFNSTVEVRFNKYIL